MIKRVLVALAILFLFSCTTPAYSDEPSTYSPLPTQAFTPIAVVPPPSLIPYPVIPTPAPTAKLTLKPIPKPKPKYTLTKLRGVPYGIKVSGSATYCAPTPKYCRGWDRSYVAAVGSFKWGSKPYKVKVCSKNTGKCIIVRVVSFCACGKKNGIDLSVPAFKAIDGMWRGRINVTVQRVK